MLATWLTACSDDAATSTPGTGGSGAGGSGAAASGGSGALGGSANAGSGGSAAGTGGASGSSSSGGSAGTGGASSGGVGGAGTGGSGACAADECPAPNGSVEWLCRNRFMYGINYAWHHFGGDFGGIPEWNQQGVAANSAAVSTDLADMSAHGVSAVRWWVFPDFRGDGATIDGSGTATGLGSTTLADLSRALELAAQHDLYLMLTLFSFDGFRPTRVDNGINIPSLQPMVIDQQKRTALLENVVRPFARAAEASPNRDRLIAWDVINEPEWAMTGPSPYGDENYSPNSELTAVTHTQMEVFVNDVVGVLRQESGALVSVGSAAMKWKRAWSAVDTDFHHFHMYGWVNDWWPYDQTPAFYGLDDKPIVWGEFPLGNLTATDTYADVVGTWWNIGYAGAMAWQYNEGTTTQAQLNEVLAFTTQNACEKRY